MIQGAFKLKIIALVGIPIVHTDCHFITTNVNKLGTFVTRAATTIWSRKDSIPTVRQKCGEKQIRGILVKLYKGANKLEN